MIKSIIQEIFIMLLLVVAVVLILGILFYDYIPTNKIVPTKEAYETPNNVKEEISEEIVENTEITNYTYEVTEDDLILYKQTSNYKPGKSNPFALEVEKTENVNTNSSTQTGEPVDKGEAPSESENTDNDSDSTGSFFDDAK